MPERMRRYSQCASYLNRGFRQYRRLLLKVALSLPPTRLLPDARRVTVCSVARASPKPSTGGVRQGSALSVALRLLSVNLRIGPLRRFRAILRPETDAFRVRYSARRRRRRNRRSNGRVVSSWPNEVHGLTCPTCGASGIMAYVAVEDQVVGDVEVIVSCDCGAPFTTAE